jgi:Ca2+-binding RTX toxin-like protein
MVTEAFGEGIDTVKLAADFNDTSYILPANVEFLDMSLVVGTVNINGTGNALANNIIGNAGNNTLNGIVNAAGVDTLIGGAGNDYYIVGNVGDVVLETLAGDGIDTVQTPFSYTVGTNIENIVLTGTNTTGTGDASNNVITSNSGPNTLIGLAGDDTYVIHNIGDIVSETVTPDLDTGGIDLVQSSITYVLPIFVENLTLTGSGLINGTGNSLDNIITSNSAVNTLNGGGGIDTYVINNSADIIVDNALGIIQTNVDYNMSLSGHGSSNIILQLLGSNNISGTGNSLQNTIIGNSGDNTLDGGYNSSGPTPADTLIGGLGNDYYMLHLLHTDNGNFPSEVMIENDSEGTDTIQLITPNLAGTNPGVPIVYTIPDNFENIVVDGFGSGQFGSSYILTGTNFSNVFNVNFPSLLFPNSVVLQGLQGDDTYYVNDSHVSVEEPALKGGIDTVISTVSYGLTVNVENLTLVGSGNLSGTGSALDNIITSNSGVDTLMGATGQDTYIINNSSDIIIDSDSGSVVQSNVSYDLSNSGNNFAGMSTTLTLMGTGNINGTGDGSVNTIIGNSGINSLFASGGGDTLIGGGGADFLFASGNTTALKYNNPTEGTDTVFMTPGSDYFLLSKATFNVNANSTGTILHTSDFVTAFSSETAISHFIFDATSHSLFYDADANGPGLAVNIAFLPNGLSLTAADIHLF